jgi:hypothetical protein
VVVSNRAKGWDQRFKDAHTSSVIPDDLFQRWEKKRTQANTASTVQRASGKKAEFVRGQLALEREMDACIDRAQATRIEATGDDTNARVKAIEKTLESLAVQLGNVHSVAVEGRPVVGIHVDEAGDPIDTNDIRAVSAASRVAKGAWTTCREAAQEKKETNVVIAKEARMKRLEEAAKRIADAEGQMEARKEARKAKAAAKAAAEPKAKGKARAKGKAKGSGKGSGKDVADEPADEGAQNAAAAPAGAAAVDSDADCACFSYNN